MGLRAILCWGYEAVKHPFFGDGRCNISRRQASRRAASSEDGCALAGADPLGCVGAGVSCDAAVARLDERADIMPTRSANERITDFCDIEITPSLELLAPWRDLFPSEERFNRSGLAKVLSGTQLIYVTFLHQEFPRLYREQRRET
jgi:hypothetical protein